MSEPTLHLMAFLGGWPGALMGQRQFRHTTQKATFRIVFWIVVVLHVGIVGAVVSTTIAATSSLDRNRQGLAAGLLTTSQQVGGALGAAIAGVIDAPARVSSFEISLVVATVVVGVALAVAVTSLRAVAGQPVAAGEASGEAA